MLRQHIAADHEYLTKLRRDIHQQPELMYEEVETSARVVKELESIGVQFRAGLAGGTGVLGYIPATGDRKATVALRADMDALPIHEETGLPYSSQTPGKMHACGHDGHTAILVGVARALSKLQNRDNDVLLVFQPAEEGGAGGRRMCEDGVLDGSVIGTPADVIYGLHGWPENQQGKFFWKVGPMMAATDQFTVKIHGKGGHAAAPHSTRDPIVAISQIVTALQTIASRNTNPLDSIVVTVGALNGGSAFNVIPESMTLMGTMRTLLPETRVAGKNRFYEIVEGIASSMGCEAEIKWNEGYPVTANDEEATKRFIHLAEQKFGSHRVEELHAPVMGGEDFSFYGAHVPASFYFVGLQREGDSNPALVHTPQFDFNDAVIPDCVEMMCTLALEPVNLPSDRSNREPVASR
ncbi:amidohydrolase [Kamptonema cortianum]|nr:amidohydrolase [Geitlerinema splendidum]MDK3155308.1 amidohydrolase [Kamptonema cortianum]